MSEMKSFKVKGTYGTMYYVKDVMKTVAFLTEKLGIQPGYQDPEWSEFPLNGHSLCLHPAGDKNETFPNGALILHVDGIHHLVEDLKSKGMNVSGPHEIHPGAYHAHFNDIDGNVISFYEGPKSA